MTEQQAMELIAKALFETIEREESFSVSTDLVEDEILDSLDSAVFMLELEKLAKKQVPQKDVTERQLYKVGNLVSYLTTN